MKRKIFISVALAGLMSIALYAQQEKSPYMGGKVDLMTAPNGAVINAYSVKRLEKAHPTKPQIIKVTDGVWQLAGMSINFPVVIEGKEGLIVYDTGDNTEEGKHFLDEIKKLSDKPVKTIIYSHAHYVGGASAIAEGRKDVMVIGNPKLNDNILHGGGLGTVYPEIAPLQMARALKQFNNFTPRKGPDAPVAGIIEIKENGFMPVTKAVKDGEVLTVDGIKMQFFTKYESDTDDCLTVWLPGKKIVLNNFLWPFMPNFYTPRGSLYRDPFSWIHGLELIRALEPEIILSTHTIPIKGKEKVKDNINLYRDGIALIMDQTLRGILKGYGPDELRHFVKLPPHIENFPLFAEGYGELQWYPPYFFNHAIGWWDGDAATLYKLAPDDEAKRLVDMMGGRDKVLSAAKESFDKNEFAWTAQLTTYLLRINPDDQDVKSVKAKALREMGHRARGSIMRSYALTEALELEGKVKTPVIVPPKAEDVVAADPGHFLNHFRVRIDPVKAKDTTMLVKFVFTDANNKALGLHLRQGVVEYIPDISKYDQKPDDTIMLDRKAWAALFLGEKSVKELIDSGAVKLDGNRADVVKFFSMFDKFQVYKGPRDIGNGVEDMWENAEL